MATLAAPRLKARAQIWFSTSDSINGRGWVWHVRDAGPPQEGWNWGWRDSWDEALADCLNFMGEFPPQGSSR